MSQLTTIKNKAFTLIELSIALVVIGLIIGGVLIGQDLYRSAQISATIKQVQNYQGAVSTFRDKYSGLPGDIRYTLALSLGFYGNNMDGSSGKRDGNSLITSNGNNPWLYGEPLIFWRDLQQAELINEIRIPSGTPDYVNNTLVVSRAEDLKQYLPSAKMGTANVWAVYSDSASGASYFHLIKATGFNTTAYINGGHSLTANEAYQIDLKLDDGKPNSGNVTAYLFDINAPLPTWPTTTSAGSCASGTTSSATYVSNPSNANNKVCTIRVKMDL